LYKRLKSWLLRILAVDEAALRRTSSKIFSKISSLQCLLYENTVKLSFESSVPDDEAALRHLPSENLQKKKIESMRHLRSSSGSGDAIRLKKKNMPNDSRADIVLNEKKSKSTRQFSSTCTSSS